MADTDGFGLDDPSGMYQWMLQQLNAQGQSNQQGGGGGGNGAMGLLMKAFGGKQQQQGSFGGQDAGTGDSYSMSSGGDFSGSFGGFA